ncbi:MAG: NAD(P)H-dependent oxidoreductase [Marinilabiliaceae bacterium]|nr:NAD(P)H-dependent oxidoreductase [Marinilabiliaceae bacterium]
MGKLKIIAIVGSLRSNSFHRQLAIEAGRLLGDSAELELLDFSDVPLLNPDFEYPAPDAVKRVRDIVKSANGIWFFSPEYNHFFSGALKNLIDWLSRPISESKPQVLRNKPAAVSGLSPGMSGSVVAQDHLVSLISVLNMKVMNQPRVAIPNVMQQIDTNGRLSLNPISFNFLETQAKAFVTFIQNNLK